jgi:F-type H+-transporting ATPase subunit epsilon
MPTFPARLVTPERVLVDEEVQAVILRTEDGDATFMPGHMRLIGSLVPGSVRFQREDGTEEHAAVHGGFVQVDGEHVVILAPIAERAEDIDTARAQRALEAAEQKVAESGGAATSGEEEGTQDGELARAEASRGRAEVRLEVAGARRPEVSGAT